MSRARRQQYMLRTEASEQEAVITICKFMENRYPELKQYNGKSIADRRDCRKNNRKRLQSRNRQNRHDAYAN